MAVGALGAAAGRARSRRRRCVAGLALALVTAVASTVGGVARQRSAGAAPRLDAVPPGLLISEFRTRGPAGADDEFVELYNPADSDLTVRADDASGGWAVATGSGIRFTVPDGTVIPGRGHYLGVNSVGYSLAGSPSGNGTTATGDATYRTGIPDDAGIALFRTADPGSFTPASRSDAVGPVTEPDPLYREGSGYPAISPDSGNHAVNRDEASGRPKDTGDNAADLRHGGASPAGARPGVPGPQNLSSPVTRNAQLPVTLLDPSTSDRLAPNLARVRTADPAGDATFGTVSLRRTVTNNTGAAVTRLRFRVLPRSALPARPGVADLRARTSPDLGVPVGRTVHAVRGSTLEQPPGRPDGSGYNAALSVGAVTPARPLAAGATVDVQLLFGVRQAGTVAVDVNVEALPGGGTAGGPVLFACAAAATGPGSCGNATPVAGADSYPTAGDTALVRAAPGVLADDTDADRDPLTAVPVTGPVHGTLTLHPDGSFSYTPTGSYRGSDSFTYRASDGAATSTAATVTLAVAAENDPPVAVADAYRTAQDTPLNTTTPGVLDNDTDSDGDPLTAALGTGPTHGTFTLAADGSFAYTPTGGYHGADSFTYTAVDGDAGSAPVAVALTVTPAHTAPVAVDDAYTTREDAGLTGAAPGVLANDTGSGGDPVTAGSATAAAHGTATLHADGSFSYTPDPDYHGTDTFTYRAGDGTADTAPAAVTITITPVTDPLAARPVRLAVGPVSGDVTIDLASLLDNPDGAALTLVSHSAGRHGTVGCAGLACRYVPAPRFSGTDSFGYRVRAGTGPPLTGLVTVVVAARPAGVAAATLPTTGSTPWPALRLGLLLLLTGTGMLVLTATVGRRPDPDGSPVR